MYATTATKKSVSYRRNRDCTKQFDWTYDLNCDLYNCYAKAKESPTIGYVKRMNKLGILFILNFLTYQTKIYVIKLVELSKTKLSWKPNFQQTLTQI